MLATSLAGFLVLRRAGRGGIGPLARRRSADSAMHRLEANAGGSLTVLGGIAAVPAGLSHRPGGRGAADRAAAPLVRPARSARWVRRRDRGRPLGHRSRAGRMAAGARTAELPHKPGNRDCSASAERRVLVRPWTAVLATPRLARVTSSFEWRVHREQHQRRPPAPKPPRPVQARRSSRCSRSTSRISRSRIRTRRARCSQTSRSRRSTSRSTSTPTPLVGHRLRGRRCKLEGKAETAGTVLFSLRAELRRRVPHPERAAGAACSRW